MPDKALLLGINQYKKVNALRGCCNDVDNMYDVLTGVLGFDARNVIRRKDDQVVKKEVKKQLKWLFEDAKPGDRVVLHFSGHGSNIADLDGDEDDGVDEIVCLWDMDFNDPDTYLVDDELRRWTETLPDGVHLTVVLDNCNSGTGTRLLLAPIPGKPHQQMPMRINDKVTIARALAGKSFAERGLEMAAVASRALDPTAPDVVRVRYIDPPAAVREEIARRKSSLKRGLVVAQMNHVLLAACRADQTAADATIDGAPNGAFTFSLCKTLRDGGARLSRKDLIDRVATELRNGHFDQVPQLEGPNDTGPLFGKAAMTGGDGATMDAASSSPSEREQSNTGSEACASLDQVKNVIAEIARLAPEAQVEALRAIKLSYGATQARKATAGGGGRALVYVHGICKHVAGYSDDWWSALHPFTNAFGAGTRGDTRKEVLWSDLVNEKSVAKRGVKAGDRWEARAIEQNQLEAEIREVLQDRADRHLIDAGPRPGPGESPRALADSRALISIPGLNCLDDFTVYLLDDDTRAKVIERFTSVVQPLLQSGVALDIISHSWGTVVAYEGLRQLEDSGLNQPLVHRFFTVGAALSIGPVKMRLRSGNKDGHRPAMVRRWINLNAHGDLVGGPLQGRPYQVDDDFPTLDPFQCGNFLGIVSPKCAHGSYFVAGNDAVNRDIFARFINAT